MERFGPSGAGTVAVKDMIAVAGCRQTAGIPARAGYSAVEDAAIVKRFRAAGYALAGTTHTDSGGFGTMTPDLPNPIFPARAVGGSSGGSAAAVASGAAEIGLATDTGGSARIPAAYCDLYAFKASAQRVPLQGILPLSPSFDAVGLFARSAQALSAAAKVALDNWQQPAMRPLALDEDALAACNDDVRSAIEARAANLGVADQIRLGVDFEHYSTAHTR
ncbi:MAG: amidase family protein [Pseudomonadota bacterium]